jgi:hypothetical protein
MSNKILVYTTNIPFKPASLEDVIQFAKDERKFRIATVDMNGYLANVKAGDNIITKKGNSLFVIKTFNSNLENLNEEDATYIDDLTRNYNLTKCGISSVANIVKYETWCKYAAPLIKKSNNKENSMKSMTNRLKEMFMPQEAKDVRLTIEGVLCVSTKNGYVSISDNNELVAYPEEYTIDFPVYIISKPKEQLAVGDIIYNNGTYSKITKINGDRITALSFTGAGKIIHTIKDFLFNQTMVRVVVSLTGNLGGQINPMMMLALSKDKSNLLPLMMMNQNGGNINMNPMMLMLMSKDDIDMKELLMMSALNGQNLFTNNK